MNNDFFVNLSQAVVDPASLLWARFLTFLPNLISAIIILLIGWLVAVGLDRLVTQILKQLRIDQALNSIGTKTFLQKAGWNIDASEFIGALVKWTILLISFLAASDVLGLDRITDFLNDILGYVPNLFVAIGVLLMGFLAGHFFSGVVRGFVGASRIRAATFLAAATRWAIYLFTVIVALQQLGVATQFLATFYTSLFALFALAGGLAFGLGGQKVAQKFLEDVQGEWTHMDDKRR